MINWPTVALAKLSTLGPEYGANVKAVASVGDRPRYVRITDIDEVGDLRPDSRVAAASDDLNGYTLQDGDILFARSGATVGKTYLYNLADGPCVFAGYLIRFRPNAELVHPKYLSYFLRTPIYWNWIGAKKRTAAQPNVNGAEYASLPVPLPPLSEQRRIVEILDQADALRKLRAAADDKIERILPAVFYKMFGDPATNPMGWPMGSLCDAGASVRYGLGQPPTACPGGTPLIRATNIHKGEISETGMVFVERGSVPTNRNAFLAPEEVIVVRSGAYTGDVAQVTERWLGAVAGYDLVINPGQCLCGEFLEAHLLTPHIQRHFASLKARAGQPHLNADQLSETRLLLPPRNLQVVFVECVKSVRKMREQASAIRQLVGKLFHVLLHRAFSGDLTAKWREAHIQELLAEMEQQAKSLASGCSRPMLDFPDDRAS